MKNVNLVFGVQPRDQFLNTLLGRSLKNTISLFNLGNNGKYTVIQSFDMHNKISVRNLKQCCRFVNKALLPEFKSFQYEFFGLHICKDDQTRIQIQECLNLNQLTLQILELDDTIQDSNYLSFYQVFNAMDMEGKKVLGSNSLFIINPYGVVLVAEEAEFYTSNKISNPQVCDDRSSTSSKYHFETSIRKIVKRDLDTHKLKKHNSSPIQQIPDHNFTSNLTKQNILYQSIQDKHDTITKGQFQDFKNLLVSKSLNQSLTKYKPGESFQFEIEKQSIYHTVNIPKQFKLIDQIYLLPMIYPAASYSKKSKIQEICRLLSEGIGLRWKQPDPTKQHILHQNSIDKNDLIVNLQTLLSIEEKSKIKIVLKKHRTITLNQNQDIKNYLILKSPVDLNLDRSVNNQQQSLKVKQWIPANVQNRFIYRYSYELNLYIQEVPYKIEIAQNQGDLAEMIQQFPNRQQLIIKEYLERTLPNQNIEQIKGSSSDVVWDNIKDFIVKQSIPDISDLISEPDQFIIIQATKIMTWDEFNYDFQKEYLKPTFRFKLDKEKNSRTQEFINMIGSIFQ